MGINQIISFWVGYIEIIVRGRQLEKFINLVTGSGLYLWKVKRLGQDVLQVRLRAYGFARLRGIARKSCCSLKVTRKCGWPFVLRKVLRRKMFLLGALLFCAGLFYLSTLVLYIKLDGIAAGERLRYLDILQKAGLKQGESRQRLLETKGLIEREALLRVPAAVWIGINLKGVVAEVKVVRRKKAPVMSGPSDIVAQNDGLVTKVMVIRGVPLVKEGDTVMQGQLLISGTQWYNNLQSGETYKEEVAASGVIEAKVWNDYEILEPKTVIKPVLRPNSYVHYQLRWNKRFWNLGTFGRKTRADYFWERQYKQLYRGRNPIVIVELIKDIRQEVNWQKVNRSFAEIRRAALAELSRKRQSLNEPVIDPRTVKWIDEGQFVKLQVTQEDIRDIAKVVPRVKGVKDFFGANRVQDGN